MDIHFTSIGTVSSPFKSPVDAPIQPKGAQGIRGAITISKELEDGLRDIEGFSHLYIFYLFHQSESFDLEVTPFMDDTSHGVFATRAPRRPNQLGMSIVKLVEKKENVLIIEDVDMIDGTPIIDIKPYAPQFDERKNVQTGWLKKNANVETARSDNRFSR